MRALWRHSTSKEGDEFFTLKFDKLVLIHGKWNASGDSETVSWGGFHFFLILFVEILDFFSVLFCDPIPVLLLSVGHVVFGIVSFVFFVVI